MIKQLNSLNNFLESIEKSLVILSFACMVIFSFLNVILRVLYTKFNIQWANSALVSIDWSEPFSRLMLLWVTFLGASLLTRGNLHIRIDFIGSFLSPFFIAVRELVLSIASVAVCFFMVWASIGYIKMEINYGNGVIAGLPAWIWQVIIPFGFTTILFRFLLNIPEQILVITGRKSL